MTSEILPKSTLRRKRAVKEIEESGDPSYEPCVHCSDHSIFCVMSSSSRSLKCSSCANKGMKCVNTSWKSLDETREQTRAKIEKDMDELVAAQANLNRIIARLSRRRKILSFAERNAERKTICLLDELEEEEEIERKANGGLSNGEIAQANADLSSFLATADGSAPVDWNAMGFSDETPIVSGGPSSGAT